MFRLIPDSALSEFNHIHQSTTGRFWHTKTVKTTDAADHAKQDKHDTATAVNRAHAGVHGIAGHRGLMTATVLAKVDPKNLGALASHYEALVQHLPKGPAQHVAQVSLARVKAAQDGK